MIEVRGDGPEKLAVHRNARRAEVLIGFGSVRIVINPWDIADLINHLHRIASEIKQDREDREFDEYTA